MSTKRTSTGEAVDSVGSKFHLDKTDKAILYAVVSPFNGVTYVHLRKYYNDLPTKFGVCFPAKDWFEFVNFVNDSTTQFSTENIDCHKTKNGAINLKCEKKDVTLYLKKTDVESLILR